MINNNEIMWKIMVIIIINKWKKIMICKMK